MHQLSRSLANLGLHTAGFSVFLAKNNCLSHQIKAMSNISAQQLYLMYSCNVEKFDGVHCFYYYLQRSGKDIVVSSISNSSVYDLLKNRFT